MNKEDAGYFQQWFVLLDKKLNRILNAQNEQGEKLMALDLSAIKDAIEQATTAEKSAEVLVTSMADKIAALASQVPDPATQTMLDNLAGTLKNESANLAAAVVANTNSTTSTTPASTATTAGPPVSAKIKS